MKSLDHDPQVIQLASELGLNWKTNPVDQITAYCAKKIAGWIKPFESAITIDGIQRIASSKLRLVFEEFRSWQELEAIIEKYGSLGDAAFAALRDDFSNPTIYATLMRRANPDPRACFSPAEQELSSRQRVASSRANSSSPWTSVVRRQSPVLSRRSSVANRRCRVRRAFESPVAWTATG